MESSRKSALKTPPPKEKKEEVQLPSKQDDLNNQLSDFVSIIQIYIDVCGYPTGDSQHRQELITLLHTRQAQQKEAKKEDASLEETIKHIQNQIKNLDLQLWLSRTQEALLTLQKPCFGIIEGMMSDIFMRLDHTSESLKQIILEDLYSLIDFINSQSPKSPKDIFIEILDNPLHPQHKAFNYIADIIYEILYEPESTTQAESDKTRAIRKFKYDVNQLAKDSTTVNPILSLIKLCLIPLCKRHLSTHEINLINYFTVAEERDKKRIQFKYQRYCSTTPPLHEDEKKSNSELHSLTTTLDGLGKKIILFENTELYNVRILFSFLSQIHKMRNQIKEAKTRINQSLPAPSACPKQIVTLRAPRANATVIKHSGPTFYKRPPPRIRQKEAFINLLESEITNCDLVFRALLEAKELPIVEAGQIIWPRFVAQKFPFLPSPKVMLQVMTDITAAHQKQFQPRGKSINVSPFFHKATAAKRCLLSDQPQDQTQPSHSNKDLVKIQQEALSFLDLIEAPAKKRYK